MKKPAARAGRKSKLWQAVEAGAVPRARRPFQCFVSQNGLQLGAAAKIWKGMSDEEKLPYAAESKRTFDRQREAAGLAVRGDGSREEPGLPKLCGTWIGQDQKYAIGEQCGAGTYGVVYKATDRRTGVIVAVKIELRCETIHTELACLNTLRGHPAFLHVEDSHVDWRGMSWMIMPMLKTSLRQLLPVAPDAQMAVCVQSLSGLSYMHDKSLLHCDVKPSNIMFCEHTRKVHIIDFGLAVQIPARECRACYTSNYRAPELWVDDSKLRGKRLRPASDSWAMGMTLLETGTGKPFFTGSREAVVASGIQSFSSGWTNVRSKERARWELALEKLPQRLRSIVRRLTVLDASQRGTCKIAPPDAVSLCSTD